MILSLKTIQVTTYCTVPSAIYQERMQAYLNPSELDLSPAVGSIVSLRLEKEGIFKQLSFGCKEMQSWVSSWKLSNINVTVW